MKHRIIRRMAAPLMAVLLTADPSVEAKALETPEGKQWKAKYVSGQQPIQRGAKLAVTVNSDRILVQRGSASEFSIPVTAVVEIAYEPVKGRSRGLAWYKVAEVSGAAGAAAGPGGVILSAPVWAPAIVGAAVLAPFKRRKHYVHIRWRDGEDFREEVLELPKGDIAAFLAELERVTGKPATYLKEKTAKP